VFILSSCRCVYLLSIFNINVDIVRRYLFLETRANAINIL